jgi:hypothetical protein
VTIHTQGLKTAESYSVGGLLQRAWQVHPLLTICLLFMTLSGLLSLIGIVFDQRTVLGMPAWSKTFKFSISLGLYFASFLVLLTHVTRHPRVMRLIGSLTAVLLLVEMILIIIQGFRGQSMHFNVSTPFNAALWSAMGQIVMLFYWVTMIGWLVLLREPLVDLSLRWAVRLGFLIAIIGMGQGFLMTDPTAEQLQRLNRFQKVDLVGAHTIGAADGGAGLPMLGWSTEHGDLRIGHFVGLHALQAIPLLALLVKRFGRGRLRPWAQLGLVILGALGYLGLVGLLTWQALRGQPLLAPDALTLTALAGLIGGVLLVGGLLAWCGIADKGNMETRPLV